jgi:pimeloyl-ACP methyl ester carboxylesterase
VQAIAAAGRSSRGFHRRGIGFHGPVAALWGEHDALVPPAHVDALRAALPHAHVEVWPGMGHHPQRERPRQLAHFLRLHDAARADAPPARPLRARTA